MGYSQNSTTVVGVIWNSQGLGVWNKGHRGLLQPEIKMTLHPWCLVVQNTVGYIIST